jgi:hypothetical protein
MAFQDPLSLLPLLLALFSEKMAEEYRRAFRRMAWLGTQDQPVERARETARLSYWTMKGQFEKGV